MRVLLQTTSPSMVVMILQMAAAIVIPAVSTFLLMQVSKLSAWVSGLADWEKRILVVVYAVVITGIAHALKLSLPEALGALSSTDVQAILTSAVSFLLYRLFKPATPAIGSVK